MHSHDAKFLMLSYLFFISILYFIEFPLIIFARSQIGRRYPCHKEAELGDKEGVCLLVNGRKNEWES